MNDAPDLQRSTSPASDLPPALHPDLLERLNRFGEVRSAQPLVGGRGGRTFAVDHGEDVWTVVHLRHGGADALEREAAAGRRAHLAGVGPEIVDVAPEHGALVTRWVPGTVLTADHLREPSVLAAVARSVRLLHDAPLDDAVGTYDALGFRRRYLAAAAERGVVWPADVAAEEECTAALVVALEAIGLLEQPVGIHADLVPSNLVWTADGVVLLDHEYAGRADPAHDLGGLAATAELDDHALEQLVAAYAGAGPTAVTLDRVRAWRDVVRHAWYVWITLGEDLGPERDRWIAWAGRVRSNWTG